MEVEGKEQQVTADGAGGSEAIRGLQGSEAEGMGGDASLDGSVLCLNPGDVLHIPRGFAHHAATAPAGHVRPSPESEEPEGRRSEAAEELDAGASLHVTFRSGG